MERRTLSPTVVKTVTPALQPPAMEGDVGMDLPATESCTILPGQFAKVWTEVKVELPTGVWGLVAARSNANFGGKLIVLPGVIDTGYRGVLGVAVHNVYRPTPWKRLTNWLGLTQFGAVHVAVGQSIGQLVLIPSMAPYTVQLVEHLNGSSRGSNGFGSTGNGVNKH